MRSIKCELIYIVPFEIRIYRSGKGFGTIAWVTYFILVCDQPTFNLGWPTALNVFPSAVDWGWYVNKRGKIKRKNCKRCGGVMEVGYYTWAFITNG